MPALVALAPAIVSIVLMALKWFGEKTLEGEKKEKFFESIKNIAVVYNLDDLVEQWESFEKQKKAGSDAWDRIEAEEAAKKKGKK